MLHNIEEEFRCEFEKIETLNEHDYVVTYAGDTLLLKCESGGDAIPRTCDYSAGELEQTRYLFSIGEKSFFLNYAPIKETELLRYKNVQALRELAPKWMAFAGATAYHLGYWYAHNRFCGVCGKEFGHSDKERALVCPNCGYTKYPEISPVVIVAVTNGDKIVLTRYAHAPYRRYALVAGFVEIGETLEDTVRREVLEEVGLRVKNVTYYDNQPWGFTRTLLMGFFAEVDGGREIRLDENELSEAVWVRRGDMPESDANISLTATMMEAFRRGKY